MNSSRSPVLPNEFRLGVTCCRLAYAGGEGPGVAERARLIDWTRFLAVARRHRIEGLAWHGLDRSGIALPDAIARNLASSAREIAEHGLRTAAESARLMHAFGEAGIDLIFIKGLTVGRLAYGNPFLKMSWDLDVLIARDRVPDAAALLEKLGYSLILPSGSPDGLEAWHDRRKESVWLNRDRTIHLELHSRLVENPRMIPTLGMESLRQRVEVAPGVILPTLARDELFAYLCVHGAMSGWHRLKWLADLAALLHGLDEKEIDRLHAAATRLGAGRATGQALVLAHRLFETPVGDALRRRLEADRATRWLVRIALGRMLRGDPTEARFGTVMIHASHLLLARGWSEKWRELRRKVGELMHRDTGKARSGTD